MGSRVSGLLERSPGESHRILWLAAVRFGSLRLRCVGFGSIRFGSVFGDSGEARVVCVVAPFGLTLLRSWRRRRRAAFNALSITNLIVCMMWAKCSDMG